MPEKLFIAALSAGAGDSTLQGLLQSCGDQREEFSSWIGCAQVEADAPGITNDNGSDADEFVSDGGACGIGLPGMLQRGAPDMIEEHVGE